MEPAEEPALDLPAVTLLARLEPLPYPLRMRALALHARRLAGTPRLSALLHELSHDRCARRTALHLAMAARDLDFLRDVLAGPDMELRRAALRAVRTLPVPDAAVAAALRDAPARLRLALYRTLAHSRRSSLAESLLPEVHARWGDREAAALLPACGSEVVARWLPGLAHAVTSWTALTKRHAGAVMTMAEQELPALEHAGAWWRRRGRAIELASAAEPARMLDLLERHGLSSITRGLPSSVVNALFRQDAVRAGRLFGQAWATGWYEPPEAVLRHLRRASDAELARLASGGRRLGPVLRALPPSRRAAVFAAAAGRRSDRYGLWAKWELRWLPADAAAAEARRMLAWYHSTWHSARSRLDDPAIALELTSYLPFEEAAGPLREAAVGGDSRRRGLARTLLIQCVARTRDRVAFHALLAELALRTVNEQDPLRQDLLTALGEVPPGLLDDSCAGTLERLATDAANAPDLSPATRVALRALAGRVLRHHDPAAAPALISWALGTYGKLVARHGADGLPAPGSRPSRARSRRRRLHEEGAPAEGHQLDLVLRTGQERDLLAVLRPHLRAAREREDFTLAVALARALGRRAWGLAELQDDLRAAIRTAPEPLARDAADLWLTRPHNHRRRRTRPHDHHGPRVSSRPPEETHPATDPQTAETERRLQRTTQTQPPAEPEQRTSATEPQSDMAGMGAGERDERAVELVREDSSAVTLPAVWRTVARRRTDLLVPLLEREPGRGGRFGEAGWVPVVGGGDAGRWTPGQRDRVRARLAATVTDEGLPIATRMAAIQATGRMGGELELLSEWAEREETVLAEAAVAAMAGAGTPAVAVPVLVGHAGGRAARVAVAALSRACTDLAPSLLGPLLEEALTSSGGKVTLRKLAARQLARNRPPGAMDALLRVWADPGLHRDVRVTVASVLRWMPQDPRVLDALGEAAGPHAGELMLRTLLQAHPLEYAPADRPRYADLVRRLLLTSDLPGVRFRAAKAFALWAPWYRGGFEEIIEAAANPAGAEQDVEVFLALLRAGVIRFQALGVLERLAAAVPGEGPETPARVRVSEITGGLVRLVAQEWDRRSRGHTSPREAERRLAREALDLLAAHPPLLPQAVRLAVALLPAGTDGEVEPEGFGDELCALADLLADRPMLAARTAHGAISGLFSDYGRRRPVAPRAALPAARRLADRGDLAGSLFALMIVQAGGERSEWSAPWRDLLLEMRHSPHIEIRQDAWDTAVE